MKHHRLIFLSLALIPTVLILGCSTKFGRTLEKNIESTKNGITNTTTSLEEGVKNVCDQAPRVSDDADEILRLVSSEDNTVFTVDGKKMGAAKQLKVCINSSGEHTVKAEPPGCDAKVERIKPPYDFPIYEFRYMLAECHEANAPAAPVVEAVPELINIPVKRKSKRKSH